MISYGLFDAIVIFLDRPNLLVLVYLGDILGYTGSSNNLKLFDILEKKAGCYFLSKEPLAKLIAKLGTLCLGMNLSLLPLIDFKLPPSQL